MRRKHFLARNVTFFNTKFGTWMRKTLSQFEIRKKLSKDCKEEKDKEAMLARRNCNQC